jgi:hypothetical protein
MADTAPGGRLRGLVRLLAGSLAFAGCFNFWAAIYLISHAASFAAVPRYVFGDLRAWGFVTLAIAIAQFGVAGGLLTGSQRARWTGAGLALLNAFGQISGLPGYPLWFLVITAVDMVALFGLAIYGMPAREGARRSAFPPG